MCLRWLCQHRLAVSFISQESWVLCLLLLCSLMMCTNNQILYDPIVILVCLHITSSHYHHYADLSEGIGFLKCLPGTFCLKCVSKISQFSQLSFMQYMGLCVFSLPISLMMIVRIHVLYLIITWNHLSNWKYDPFAIVQALGHETMICTVCICIFLLHC